MTAYRAGAAGALQLEIPAGWKVKPATQSFHLAAIGDHAKFKFTVTAPAEPATATIVASAEIGGVHYDNERVEINYPHIPLQLLQPPASLNSQPIRYFRSFLAGVLRIFNPLLSRKRRFVPITLR